jgi:hypothetical protein
MEFTKAACSLLRKICSSRIVWIFWSVVQEILYKLKGMVFEAALSWDLTMSNGASIKLKVPAMMSSQEDFQIDDASFFVAFLNGRLHETTKSVLGEVIVSPINHTALSRNATSIQTLRI